jgi:recombination protein RecR
MRGDGLGIAVRTPTTLRDSAAAAALSALEGVRPEDLNIDGLIRRVAAGGIDEIVLAMNATLEGQTTAHYLAERLEGFPIRLSQLAHGLPVGGELDYLDEGTLAQALRARRPIS